MVVAAAAALAGAAAAFASGDWNVTDTGQPSRDLRFTVSEGTWMSVDVSPDGATLVFDLLGDIYALPAAGGEARLVHGGPAMQRTPRFSADGSRILYISDAGGIENAWTSRPDGGDARPFTRETANLVMAAAWGPDADSIVVERIGGRYPQRFASEIRLYDAAGGSRTLVPTPANGREVAEPAMSRDGRHVYYSERLASDFQIYIDAMHQQWAIRRRELATGAVEDVAAGWGGALAPQASPDGRRLAFVRRVKDKTVLFDLALASRSERAVFGGLDRDLQASFEAQANYYPHYGWFPDSRHVAIWAGGRILRVDMDTGAASEIPFRVTSEHRITEPVRFAQDLAPQRVEVRAVRGLALAPQGHPLVFTALARLWLESSPGAAPRTIGSADAAGFEPAFSADGRKLAWVEWNDERGGALVVGTAEGGRARTIASSRGVIREPSFSPDGRTLVYRIQAPDVNMGGARARPGIYRVPVDGGKSTFVTPGDWRPYFAPDGRRIFFVAMDYGGESPAEVLASVTLDGLDRREHARTPDADTSELRPSPDHRWIAFRERQEYHLVPWRETGSVLDVSAHAGEVPSRRLTEGGGFALAWSADSSSVQWVLGPALYRATATLAGGPERVPRGRLALEVPADIPGGAIAFTNARIITMRGTEVIEAGTVVVEGNRIRGLGPADSVAIPAGARVIDAAGKTIMPGLVDAHGHIDCCWRTGAMPQKQPALYAALAYGVTTNFDPYPNELTSFENGETQRAGITVGPRWITTGTAIWGRPQNGSNDFEPIADFEDARRVIARKRAIGAGIVKSYRYPGRRERQMLVKAGREAGVMVDVEGESQFYNNVAALLDGHTNLEHNLPVANYYDDLVQLFAGAGVPNTPTLVVAFGELFGENYLYQTTEAWKEPKVRTFVQEALTGYSPLLAPYGAPPYVRAMTTIHAADELWEIGFRAVARSTRKLDDAGVTINAGSHGQVPGLAMHWEMRLLAEGGMSPLSVLRTATINPARTLGVDRQIGSLEPGKLADLIVLDADPLADIANTNSVRFTMVNGRLFDASTMNEIGNRERPRTKFFWELPDYRGIGWNEAWAGSQ
jgi:Tol biopolymer transport system component